MQTLQIFTLFVFEGPIGSPCCCPPLVGLLVVLLEGHLDWNGVHCSVVHLKAATTCLTYLFPHQGCHVSTKENRYLFPHPGWIAARAHQGKIDKISVFFGFFRSVEKIASDGPK